jgi:hypothetical protein
LLGQNVIKLFLGFRSKSLWNKLECSLLLDAIAPV